MARDFIVYNVSIYPYTYAARDIVYKSMLVQRGFISALSEEHTVDADVDIKKLDDVIDARKWYMIPPMVQYISNMPYAVLCAASPFNVSNFFGQTDKPEILRDISAFYEALYALKKTHKRPYIVYNYDGALFGGPALPPKDQLEAVFGKETFAVFDSSLKSCVVSNKILQQLGVSEPETHDGVFEGGEFEKRLGVILSLLLRIRPAMISDGLCTLLREAAKYGVKAFVTHENSELCELIRHLMNAQSPIKLYRTSRKDLFGHTDLFAQPPFYPLNPFQRIYELCSKQNSMRLSNAAKLFAGKMFGVSEISGEIKKGISCDYLLTDTDILHSPPQSLQTIKIRQFVINGDEVTPPKTIASPLKIYRELIKLAVFKNANQKNKPNRKKSGKLKRMPGNNRSKMPE